MTRTTHLAAATAILLLLVAPGLTLTSCGHTTGDDGKTASARKAPAVQVAKAKEGDISRTIEFAGTIEPTRLARLASPAEGPVARLAVREGDRTQRGQTVVVIGRDQEARAGLEADREALRNAEDEFERIGRLVEQGAVAGELLDDARTELERARATVAAGKQRAADHLVTSPWAGIVSSVLVQEGNYVAPHTPLVELFDPESLVIRVGLPESSALSVEVGAEAQVTFDAIPGTVYSVSVERLYPDLDRTLRTRTAELAVPDGLALVPGMFSRVSLVVEQATDSVVLPGSAIVTTPAGGHIVYTVEDSTATAQAVELGIEDGRRVQVVSGLDAGQQVIVGGTAKLRDGSAVTLKRGSPGERRTPTESAAETTPCGQQGQR